jgi:hypothetical protein
MINFDKKLDSITSEVKEFHPLLNSLFEKMPDIESVEYKQGTQENGADFVLTKKSLVPSRKEYVAVVVKIGNIKKDDHKVASQIDECISTDRVVEKKKAIYVDEIWVIASGGISVNTQEYFSGKYRAAKVKFLAKNDVVELLKAYYPEFFEKIPSYLVKFFSDEKTRLKAMEMGASVLTIPGLDFHLSQKIIPLASSYKKTEQYVRPKRYTIEEILDKKSVAIIEGEMGSGKSTLLRRTALSMIDDEYFEREARVPVYGSFLDFKEHHWDIEELIKNRTGSDIQQDIKYVVMLDGMDEVKLPSDENARLIDKIVSFSNRFSNLKVVLTSRRSDVRTAKERPVSECRIYSIAPISMSDIVSVIEKVCSDLNVKNKVLADLKSSELYKSLPHTPLAAVLLARLLSENHQNIPSNLTELYAKFTELSLGRWDGRKGLINEREYEAADSIVSNIANYIISNQLVMISVGEAKDFFESYLRGRNLGINAENLFNKISGRCDLFFLNHENNTFSFRHRTFAEFFCARDLRAKRKSLSRSQYFDLYFTTVGFFYIGLEKDCPEIIDELARYMPEGDKEAILKLINFGNMILAGYKTENSVISSSVKIAFIQMAELFIDIASSKRASVLSQFSEMQLLSLFAHIISESYGYDFFNLAIQEAMYDISADYTLDNDAASVAMFFLNAAQTSPDSEEWFKSLTSDRFKSNPPRVSVQLAVRHESLSKKITNKYIKKIQKITTEYTKKLSTKNYISKLYDLPIKKLEKKVN